MSGPLNLAHLKSLIAVVDHDGFTRAARALHLSQSTVSQHIYLLEQRVDSSLVVRDHRGLTLTTAGERLLADARDLLAAHDAILERFVPHSRPALSIGSTEHAADQLLPKILAGLQHAFSDHRVSFALNRSPELAAAVAADRLDIALTLAVTPDGPGARVGSLPLCWLRPADQRPTDRTVSLVAFDGTCGIRERALTTLRKAGRDVEVAVEASTLDGVLAAVRAGLGIALLPVAGGPPPGLETLDDLPQAGAVDVRLIARHGLDPAISRIAADAVSAALPATTAV